MRRQLIRALAAGALAAAVAVPVMATAAQADIGDLAPISVPHVTVPSDLQGTTVEGTAYVTTADCSVDAVISGDNQSSTGEDGAAPSSSDCVRRLAIDSPGANATTDAAIEESGVFSDFG